MGSLGVPDQEAGRRDRQTEKHSEGEEHHRDGILGRNHLFKISLEKNGLPTNIYIVVSFSVKNRDGLSQAALVTQDNTKKIIYFLLAP